MSHWTQDLPDALARRLDERDRPLAAASRGLVLAAVPTVQVIVRRPGELNEQLQGRQLAALARREDGFRLYLALIYEHPELLPAHDVLQLLLIGRSCLHVRTGEELPQAAVRDVLMQGAAYS